MKLVSFEINPALGKARRIGVPIDGEAGVGYLMREGFELPPLMFTRDEIVALVAGARMVRAFGGAAMARAAEEALVKIGTVLPEPERDRIARLQDEIQTHTAAGNPPTFVEDAAELSFEEGDLLRAVTAYAAVAGDAPMWQQLTSGTPVGDVEKLLPPALQAWRAKVGRPGEAPPPKPLTPLTAEPIALDGVGGSSCHVACSPAQAETWASRIMRSL